MAKFLLLSGYGEGLGVALRLKQNGHDVGVWIRDKRSKLSYDGLLRKVGRWEDFLDKQTTVLFDSTGGGSTADRLRSRGFNVFGGSVFADELEEDRALAFELLKKVGVKIPSTKTFYDWDSARAYAKRFEGRLAFKASGALARQDGLGTYVASDPEDMVEMLYYFESISKVSPEFELQQVVKGLALSTEGYFNGETFMHPFNHTLEHKSTLNDDLGPSSGCAINVVWAVENTNHVIEEGLRRMEPVLRDNEYVGPIDLNTIVNPEGVWALEFTPRWGYDATPTLLELFNADPADLFIKLARNERVREMEVSTGEYAGGVRVHVPPHPSEEFKHSGNVPVRGLEKGDRPHLYFYNVMLDGGNRLVTSPDSYGIVMAVTSRAPSVTQAMVDAYRLADKAKIPEKQYRTDGVGVMEKDFNEFRTLVGLQHNVLKAKEAEK